MSSQSSCKKQLGQQSATMQCKGVVEYVWLSADGSLHSKTRVLPNTPHQLSDIPDWPVDTATLAPIRPAGLRSQLTGQLQGPAGVTILRPQALFPDPIRGQGCLLALCAVFVKPAGAQDAVPHSANNRAPCQAVLQSAAPQEPTFSFEQQFCLLDKQTGLPLGVTQSSAMVFSDAQQCGVGSMTVAGRNVVDDHLNACLQAGLEVASYAAEAVPGQWCYTVGPVTGIAACDQLWVSRYLLQRLSERYNVVASLHPKPVPGAWDGCACPVSFSTDATRTPGPGFAALQAMITKLQEHHLEHIIAYGSDTARHMAQVLPGKPGGGLLNFTIGVDDKSASVSVPTSVILERCGHLTDRRCASNIDPYLVSMLLTSTCCDVPLPQAQQQQQQQPHLPGPLRQAGSPTQSLHSGSSTVNTDQTLDILADIDLEQALQPDTPPQTQTLQQSTGSQAVYSPQAAG